MHKKIYRLFTNPHTRYSMKRKILEILFRKKIVSSMRKRLDNQGFSIISSDCIGGLVYHDLQMQFKSPTVNMAIPAHSFVNLCSNLKYYMDIEPLKVKSEETYPVMRIDDVILNGIHYHSFEELRDKWNERKKRINYDNLFMIFTTKDGFDETLLPLIDKIPGNKVLFSNKPYEYDWCCYLPEFANEDKVGDLTRYVGILGYKYYDNHFDVIKWLNGSSTIECINGGQYNGK